MSKPVAERAKAPRADPSEIDLGVPESIDPAHRAAVAAGLADMRAGRIATAAEVETAYARFARRAR